MYIINCNCNDYISNCVVMITIAHVVTTTLLAKHNEVQTQLNSAFNNVDVSARVIHLVLI